MSERDLRRQCAKCKITASEDPSLRFHRFPLPGTHCSLKARVWAEYCYPNKDWSDDVSLKKLHLDKKVLCSNHFDANAYTNNMRERLNNFAIPIGSEVIMSKLRQKHEISTKNLPSNIPQSIQIQKTNTTSVDSKRKTNRKRVLGALKRWHGEEYVTIIANRNKTNISGKLVKGHWKTLIGEIESKAHCKVKQSEKMGNKNNKKQKLSKLQQKRRLSIVLSRRVNRKESDLQRNILKVKEDKSTELCKKIRNSLKQLRQFENGNDEPANINNEKQSLLEIEILPEGTENINDTERNLDVDRIIKQEQTEFYDESETPECIDEPEEKKTKPLRRNPRRRTEHAKELLESSPLEKVFVSAIKKPDKHEQAKRTHVETNEMPSHFDHTEQLYEFGKYVAEQMMCFDEKDVRLARAEIKDVLTKFRLKYKIMNCLSNPEQPEIDAKRRKPVKSARVNSNGQKVSKFASRTNATGKSVVKSVSRVNSTGQSRPIKFPKVEFIKPVNEGLPNTNSAPVAPLGFVIEPLSVTGGFHISTQRVDSAGTIVTQPVILQGNRIGTPGSPDSISNGTPVTEPGSPHSISNETPFTEPGSSNSTSNIGTLTDPVIMKEKIIETPIGLDSSNGALGTDSITLQRRAIRTTMAESETSNSIPSATSSPITRTKPGSSHNIPTGTPLIHPMISQENIIKTKVTETESSNSMHSRSPMTHSVSSTDSICSAVTAPEVTNVNTIIIPGISETAVSKFEMPPVHFIKATAVDEQESIYVKIKVENENEMKHDSDNET